MGFIQLNELYYNGGGYTTKPLLCNTDEVSNVSESKGDYFSSTCVVMKNGKYFNVQDSFNDIVDKLGASND